MDNLEAKVKSITRETKLLAIQLAKKGSFLSSIRDQLVLMKSNDPQNAIDNAILFIETTRFRDNEFEQLEERVRSIHKDFVIHLSERHSSLTPTEQRICILLRLSLKPTDIASVLFISVRTVETHCLSIRKKLHLSRNVRLLDYLQSLEPVIQLSL